MTPNPMSEHEPLSALFDGELEGDAARFALKRLGHDSEWQQACGRWQLIGDALRGQATAAAPASLAARVATAVAAESTVQSAMLVPKPASRLRRWMGGALAASVAVAALLVARPLWQGPTSTTPMQVAESEPAAAPVSTPASTPKPAPAPAVPAPSPAAELATAVAAATLPASARSTRRSSARPRAQRRNEDESVRAVAQAMPREPAHAGASPFSPPASDIVTRPWPRAVLPDYPAAGALTASFGAPSADGPSFYPFEPRLPAAHADAPVQDPSQR